MKIESTMENLKNKLSLKKIFLAKRNKKIRISDLDTDSKVMTVEQVGVSPLGDGIVILKTDDGLKFPITSFSMETAKNISDFKEGNSSQFQSLYNMVETICETLGLILVKVRIYQSGKALRANLYFTGKNDLVLRNYRASDAIALATFYQIPILVKRDLLEQSPKIELR